MHQRSKFSKVVHAYHAILIKDEEFELINYFINQNFKRSEIIANSIDGTKIKFRSCSDLARYLKLENGEVSGFVATCSNGIEDDSAYLVLEIEGNKSYLPPIIYKFDYNDLNWGVALESKLTKVVKRLKPWYSCITSIKFVLVIPLLMAIILIIYVICFIVSNGLELQQTKPSSGIYNTLGYFSCILFLFVGWLLDLVIKYFFPKVHFSVGVQQNKRNYKKIIGSVIIAVLVGLFVKFSYELFWWLISPTTAPQ